MAKNEFGEYYLGLDIGTDSIGWAVTDVEYGIEKLNGKSLWGIRLFESAETAAERRVFRTGRRRLQRRNDRIRILQELFSKEISKIDMGFYHRMKESKFLQEDKTEDQKYALFNDKKYTDKEFYKEFPTIYHLRKALIENDKEYDVRLIYLAIHNILKHRGHFLFEGQNIENIDSLEISYRELKEYINSEFPEGVDFTCKSIEVFAEIIKDRKLGVQRKKRALIDEFSASSKQEKDILTLLAGGTANLKNIFNDETLENSEITKISFSNPNLDESMPLLESQLGDRVFLIEKLKAIYDWGVLSDMLQGEKFLSFAKVKSYDKHENDLKRLKKIVKSISEEEYKKMFKIGDDKINNYCKYIGSNKEKGKKQSIKKCDQTDFCKYVKDFLDKKELDNEDYRYLLQESENGTLMPKQISKDNSTVPYQIQKSELEVILENSASYLEFLNIKDENGLSVKEKIIKLIEFRIPYYIGPLNPTHKEKDNGFAWVIRKEKGKVLPWNFEEKIDINASAEEFITRMTNKCTYLIGADVIPKNSLLYSKYMVLNELNNLKINQKPISLEIKQNIYNDLFMKYKRVTRKKLIEYFKCKGIKIDQDEISGIDGDFKASLKSEIEIRNILGDKIVNTKMVEDIIKSIVLFGDDSNGKKMLRAKITKKYNGELNDEEIKELCSKKYSGWGRLSKEFLTEIMAPDMQTGEYRSIIQALWENEENPNLMQLLSNNYDYSKVVADFNRSEKKENTAIEYGEISNLYVSPSVKRMIWQTMKIVKEIRKVMGHDPKKIFIEMARGKEEKPTRKESRKSTLIELYKKCREEEKDWIKELEAKDESNLRSDKLYLYYTQMGKCIYSGESIDLDDLFNNNLYDIDHIYPQSKTKDDSLDNRVLVKKTYNLDKKDKYPLPREWQKKQLPLWKMLLAKNFISKKKFERLTRNFEFTNQELADFIARQIVETRQTTKAAAEILTEVFSDSEIVYVKAKNVSNFRQDFQMLKVREINDLHHAKDAYLNIVVGNVYNTRFTKSPVNFISNHDYRNYSLNRMYDFDVERGGVVAWEKGEKGSISTVKKIMKKNNILFTRQSLEKKGGFYDQQLMKKGKGQIPIKTKDERYKNIDKYGGYNKAAGAYFILVEHIIKEKEVRSIETVPIYLAKKIEGNEEKTKEYCIRELGLIEPKVIITKIKFNTLFEIQGFRMHLSGRTGNNLVFKGANQLVLSEEDNKYIRRVLNYNNRCRKSNKKVGEIKINEYDGIKKGDNIRIYDAFIEKLRSTIFGVKLSGQLETLVNKREEFIELDIEMQCVLIEEIIHIFQCNSLTTSYKTINGPASAGRVSISKEISNSIKIVNQSPTGIFEQKIDLLEQ